MVLRVYKEKRYYLSKYGEKQYLDGSMRDKVLIEAAMLTGRGLKSEEECIHTIYGENKRECYKALDIYLKINPDNLTSYREEISNH